MNTERTCEDYLRDIIENAERAERFLRDTPSLEALRQDDRTSYAVVRTLEIIGEAAKHIPESVRSRYTDLHWRGMTGMRDKVVHGYFGVDLEVVWRTVHEELPPLREGIRRILDDMEAEKSDEKTDESE